MIGVVFAGEINHANVNRALNVIAKARRKRGSLEAVIFLNSTGGGVEPALGAYEVLVGMDAHITMVNTATVRSAANLVYLAGDRRIAAPHSLFMFHGVHYTPTGNMGPATVARVAHDIATDQERVRSVFEDRTTLRGTDLDDLLFDEKVVKTPQWAVQHGVAHDVSRVPVPARSFVV